MKEDEKYGETCVYEWLVRKRKREICSEILCKQGMDYKGNSGPYSSRHIPFTYPLPHLKSNIL